ncbi:MAG TPA: hypothetical protein VFW74_18735 [Acidimicrobiia bacterium]|nr:hypothetical protein [Acidimicrobiia bacterium]
MASDLGLPMATPVVLHATNNVVVHLAPAAVVAARALAGGAP